MTIELINLLLSLYYIYAVILYICIYTIYIIHKHTTYMYVHIYTGKDKSTKYESFGHIQHVVNDHL